MVDALNDNLGVGGSAGPDPDAHGHAALLLVESLIHGLLARSALTVSEAIEIVDAASDVRIEIADSLGESESARQRSLGLLSAISQSLSYDRE